MKKLLMIAALASLSSPAFASKARLTALGNADHLVDAQTAFDNPAHLAWLPDYITFEGGPTNSAAPANWTEVTMGNPSAEGGFTQSSGDAKWGAYLGRKSAFTQGNRTNLGFLGQENTVELQYAMKGPMAWGASFNYSSSDKKSTSQKQNAMGLRLGAATDLWEGYAIVGLGSKATGSTANANALAGDFNDNGTFDAGETSAIVADVNSEFKGTTGFKVGGAYKMDNIRIYGKMYMDGFEYTSTANATLNGIKTEQSQIDVGVIDNTKLDSGSWFYGVAYQMYTFKQSKTAFENKTTASYLPFLAGIEYGATSWLDLRASVTQNVLLGTVKNDDGAGAGGGLGTYVDETNTVKNNTKVAAGFGMKFNKWAIDGSWAAATTGTMNTTAFLTNLGLTYNF